MTPTIIQFPSIANPSDLSWQLQRFDARFISPLSGTFQDIVRPGAYWIAEMSWKTLSYDDSQALAAWAMQMSRGNVRCALPNWAYTIRGSGAGTPLVNGGSQSGLSLVTDGWTASSTNVLKAGDMFEVSLNTVTFTSAPGSGVAITYVDGAGNSHSIGTGNGATTVFHPNPGFDYSSTVYLDGVLTAAYTSTCQHQLLMATANVSSDGSGNATIPIEPALRFSPSNNCPLVLTNPTAYFAFAKPSSSASYTAPRIASIAISLQEDIQI